MKYADLVEKCRDGSDRAPNEQAIIKAQLGTSTCSECKTVALCAYEIQVDRFFCSDECRDSFLTRDRLK